MVAGPPIADAAARAFVESLHLFAGALDGGEIVDVATGVTGLYTGLPVATLNGVWATTAKQDARALAAALGTIAARGVPHCLQARPGCEATAERVAMAGGMVAAPSIPVMGLAGSPTLCTPRELTIRTLAAGESSLHATVAAPAFGAPDEVFRAAITDAVLHSAGVHAYLGQVDERPVVTAVAATVGDSLGIFNVATLPEARGRGYGAAVTAHAIRDGVAAGATWSWLQSAEAAVPLYERLGYRTLERWSCWLAG